LLEGAEKKRLSEIFAGNAFLSDILMVMRRF